MSWVRVEIVRQVLTLSWENLARYSFCLHRRCLGVRILRDRIDVTVSYSKISRHDT